MQTVEDSNDRCTVVIGVADGPDVRQHIIRGLDAAALAALRRDVDGCIEADEDLEPVITTSCTMQGG